MVMRVECYEEEEVLGWLKFEEKMCF